MTLNKDVAKSRLRMANPWHLLATGFGSGLSPIVPGTVGSLAAIPFWWVMTLLPWQLYSLVVLMGICVGVYLCHRTASDMGVHDHGSIVWDEFIGMWITLMALPSDELAVGRSSALCFSVFWICGSRGRFAGSIVMCTAVWELWSMILLPGSLLRRFCMGWGWCFNAPGAHECAPYRKRCHECVAAGRSPGMRSPQPELPYMGCL